MIRLENVSKVFPINGKDTLIVDDINLSIGEGEIFGLVGGTGSGKSTILRMMTGFIAPDAGEIRLMGQRLDENSRHRLVRDTAMIFQGFHLLGNANVLENVLLPTRLRRGERGKFGEKARELLSYVGLSQHENASIRSLSGGQKQRVAIARSLMTRPRILFCDEPTSALDERMSYEILTLLKDVHRRFGTTLVIVSHDIAVIKALCNRVAIIEDGGIDDVLSLTPRKIRPMSYREAFRHD